MFVKYTRKLFYIDTHAVHNTEKFRPIGIPIDFRENAISFLVILVESIMSSSNSENISPVRKKIEINEMIIKNIRPNIQFFWMLSLDS